MRSAGRPGKPQSMASERPWRGDLGVRRRAGSHRRAGNLAGGTGWGSRDSGDIWAGCVGEIGASENNPLGANWKQVWTRVLILLAIHTEILDRRFCRGPWGLRRRRRRRHGSGLMKSWLLLLALGILGSRQGYILKLLAMNARIRLRHSVTSTRWSTLLRRLQLDFVA